MNINKRQKQLYTLLYICFVVNKTFHCLIALSKQFIRFFAFVLGMKIFWLIAFLELVLFSSNSLQIWFGELPWNTMYIKTMVQYLLSASLSALIMAKESKMSQESWLKDQCKKKSDFVWGYLQSFPFYAILIGFLLHEW